MISIFWEKITDLRILCGRPTQYDGCDLPGCRDEVVAHLLLLAALLLGRVACALELGVLEHVVGAHPVQDELGLVGHAHDVVLNGGNDTSLVINYTSYRYDTPSILYISMPEYSIINCHLNDLIQYVTNLSLDWNYDA